MWFTADLHIGHTNILRYCDRPFADIDKMNRVLFNNWNDVVRPLDEVYVLGDLALGHLVESMAPLAGLHGRKFLVPGNHDRCWEKAPKGPTKVELYEAAGFTILASQVSFLMGSHQVTACHFPYVDDDDRYVEHHPVDLGNWLLHGHVHGSWQVRKRMINVGVDVWDFAPVHADILVKLMDGRA